MRAIYDRVAPRYDKRIAFFERLLFAGGREWVCSRAVGDVLEPLALRFEGDHLLREPLDHLPATGFRIDELLRSKWGIVELVAATKQA